MLHSKDLFFIVIINWNGKNLTIKCLKSLKRAIGKGNGISVVLVDNNSSDGSVSAIKKHSFPFDFHIIANKKNVGWAGANNIGIKYALKKRAGAVFLLNNDAIVTPKAIGELINTLFSNKAIGIVSPKIYHYDFSQKKIFNAGNMLNKLTYTGKELGNGEIDKGQFDNVLETDYVSGTALVAKREVFKKIGFFDEKTFLYYEDVDFCLRARKAGFKCCFSQNSIIYHIGSATNRVGSPLHTYYNSRNRLYFLKKNAPWYVLLYEYFFLIPKLIKFIIRANKPWKKYFVLGVRDYFIGKFGQQTYW